jgi:mannose-6-phosphate isomerase-like protein (cupin superfamily)
MERHGKAWGTTALLYATRYLQAHLLEIKAGGYCSEHRHERKTNTFIVLSGRLEVIIWPVDVAKMDTTVLTSGQVSTIPVGVFHKFHALEDTVCLELYESAEIEEDIVRRTVGGNE